MKRAEKIYQAVGRLKERYPRVARYCEIEVDFGRKTLCWYEHADKKDRARKLDGSYVLKTDPATGQIRRSYMLLTLVEDAFRDMKGPLRERPVFHQLEHRGQTHTFLCVPACHLLVVIEQYFLDRDMDTSWPTVRDALRTHQFERGPRPSPNTGRSMKRSRCPWKS